MTFLQSISTVRKKYAVFKGRATRSEFWWWQLFVVILISASVVVECFTTDYTYGIITGTICLILFLPCAAISVRRCHDGGHSGWWLICPIVGVVMMLLPSQQNDNDYGSVDGIANTNRIVEKIFAGFCYSLLLPILLLTLVVVWMIYANTPVKLSIDEVPYSTTEHLRELSGMTFLPDVKFEEGVKSNWDGETSYYFVWKQPLTEQDRQRIIKFAKKSRYQQLWIYPEATSSTIVEQKVLSANETPFKIYYFEEGIRLESVLIPKDILENNMNGLKYKLVWQEYEVIGPDFTIYFDLQLQESYSILLNRLKKNGYEVKKETKNEVLLYKKDYGSNYFEIAINKMNNVVSITYFDF